MLKQIMYGLLLATACGAAAPATKPSQDSAVDWLFGQSKDAPAAKPEDDHRPTSEPASPLEGEKVDEDMRVGTMLTSDSEKIHGHFYHTAGKPFRIWVESEGEYKDIPFNMIKSLEAKVLWEREQQEWHFKASGSDIKEYTGKTYPARETEYTATLLDGRTITGAMVEPLYQIEGDEQKLYTLNKRDKGKVGQSLKDLVYVMKVEFEDLPNKPAPTHLHLRKRPATQPAETPVEKPVAAPKAVFEDQ